MVLRHEVLADEQRLAIEHADPPVELRRHVLLRQDQVGILEQLARARRELGLVRDLEHAARERAVGHLEHDREAERAADRLEVAAIEHHGLGRRQPLRREQLGQIDLVGAARDRDRIVDHGETLALGLAREAIGVVGERRGLADEQRVELAEPEEVLAADRLDLEPHLRADAHQALDRRRLRRRQLVLRVVQHGDRVARQGGRAARPPRHLEVARERAVEPGHLLVVEIGGRERLDLTDAVAADPRRPDPDRQQRMAETIEGGARQPAKARILRGAEGDQQAHRLAERLRQPREVPRQHRVEIGQRELVERLALQIEHGLHRGDHLVAARLGEQRGVVAGAEIAAVAAQVDHAHRARAKVLGPGDVDPGKPDHLAERFRKGRVRQLAEDGLHQPAVARLLRITVARSLERPYLAMSSNSRRRIGMLTRSMLVTWTEEI